MYGVNHEPRGPNGRHSKHTGSFSMVLLGNLTLASQHRVIAVGHIITSRAIQDRGPRHFGSGVGEQGKYGHSRGHSHGELFKLPVN